MVTPPLISLFSPVTELKGVGPKMAENLEKLDIEKVQDLLFHLPLRYQDRTQFYEIGAVSHGQEVMVIGEVEHSEIVYRGRRMMICTISDGTGLLTLRFFHFSNAQQKALTRGTKLRCFGEVRIGKTSREMVHPEYKILTGSDSQNTQSGLAKALTPIYPATKGLQQRSLLRLAQAALSHLNGLEDLIPHQIVADNHLYDLNHALQALHQPVARVSVAQLLARNHPAQQRLIFEELLAHQLSLRKLREQQKQANGIPFNTKSTYFNRLKDNLPFELTNAQNRVIEEIDEDLQQTWPMSRLVQGDVGSGKTLVAAAAALTAIEAGYQVALMAPTEILSEQHFKNFTDWLSPLGLNVTLLSGKLKVAEKREALAATESGTSHLIIGTHALFQNDVNFQRLGLIIVDEQHRFGVHQRLSLREKGKTQTQQEDIYPHQLVMTATPIPRTLAMTTYADMDYSVIDELPPGRTPIKTVVISNSRRDEIVQRIDVVCNEGAQVYWVCTLIEESETLQAQNAEETTELLQQALPDLKIGLVHGRMKSAEKEAIMAEFKSGKLHLLVATTVIEVGVDVPNATLMIIENAERLGLAQLHQLRGRVGRGSKASSCVLMYQTPLSDNARKRLEALRNSNDGFEIARIDLEIRGPGEVFGTRQTGELQFRIANLMEDQMLLPKVQQAAKQMLEQYPENIEPLIERWIKHAEDYASV
ncbi:ATP-dependent DNA helicase RecG [Cocleimonas sp. KMM 6892]|uniref:ATP-dependent DNA helicase RecG n=1 Tax=unclassified Cocleimonas TaxID=2639732 RepID=UPI002DC0525A|nr:MULTISPECIES: ATP-dependent DNA helicase RecG [unclassified Cocleimonas]MEB8433767.1 ATP-dependent DNA helicase RecG [Cocleimonas sp. KMM 6892]MEC4716578.1 ATP-dependent DNA helicase RecG [Cocleimonas sp. KMM 6895]MEC4746267.1 ATP-dependent DNA helicase RecG [Cocleimonas sp. KMM 6896]